MTGDPIYFPDITTGKNEKIEIRNLVEISQGGPNIGKLFINGTPYFDELWFGGPMACHDNDVYLTIRAKGIFFNGFKLCKINTDNKELSVLKVSSDIVWIKRIDNSVLYYLKSLDENAKEYSMIL